MEIRYHINPADYILWILVWIYNIHIIYLPLTGFEQVCSGGRNGL